MTRHEHNIRAQRAVGRAGETFAQAVVSGLGAPFKRLPCRFFYDARGSELFEAITGLEEYYPTRTETAILHAHAGSMARAAGRGAVLVEFGSGSSRKTELLLAAMDCPRAYVPIDVSQSALRDAQVRLARRMPDLEVMPAVGDFTEAVPLPPSVRQHRKLGFFPGSTLGNFDPPDAVALLRHFAGLLGQNTRLIIGIDLEKDPQRLLAAYNDAQGVTAEFNLNLLARINRELDANFELSRFRHVAIYDQTARRIEMHLISTLAQSVDVLGQVFRLEAGETIHTENSYKYSIQRFQALASEAGWEPAQVWTDDERDFSVHELVPKAAPDEPAR